MVSPGVRGEDRSISRSRSVMRIDLVVAAQLAALEWNVNGAEAHLSIARPSRAAAARA